MADQISDQDKKICKMIANSSAVKCKLHKELPRYVFHVCDTFDYDDYSVNFFHCCGIEHTGCKTLEEAKAKYNKDMQQVMGIFDCVVKEWLR
jgi:hypothetical protein